MERESFEKEDIAALLNAGFISIKVDREERPDIDQVYMTACQNMTGSGGWPLTVILDAEQRPFFAGTYFTHQQLISVLDQAGSAWQQRRAELDRFAERVTLLLQNQESNLTTQVDDEIVHRAYRMLQKRFDPRYGGFGSAPKFPSPQLLLFLLRYERYAEQPQALKMVVKTLRCMAQGGIQDQIGFGFSRYSTDERWLAPHFEKMLYDNALLTLAYLETAEALHDDQNQAEAEELAEVARHTLEYVLAEMQSGEGGFYTAEDADSEGVEGLFYLWTPQEVIAVLGEEKGLKTASLLDITERGNFEGRSIPNLIGKSLSAADKVFLEEQIPLLLQARAKRVRPARDDKILVSLNGLMIAALARGYRILKEPRYLQAALSAARFLMREQDAGNGRLYSRFCQGETRFLAHAEDYAFLIWGLLELYQAETDWSWLEQAFAYSRVLLEDFYDAKQGGFFFSSKDAEELIVRQKTAHDGAYPSANSVAADCLQRLGLLLGDEGLLDIADKTRSAFGVAISENPSAYTWMLAGILVRHDLDKVLIVAPQKQGYEELQRLVREEAPQMAMVCWSEEQPLPEALVDRFRGYRSRDGKATAYLCRGNICYPPVNDKDALLRQLSAI